MTTPQNEAADDVDPMFFLVRVIAPRFPPPAPLRFYRPPY